MTVDFADVVLEFPLTVVLDKLNMLIPVQRFPMLLNVESAHVTLSPLSLLLFRTAGTGEIRLYQGNILFDFTRAFWGKKLETHGTFANLSLAAHPFLGSFGLAGTLEGKFSGISIQDELGNYLPESGDFSLAMRNAALKGGIKLMQLIRIPEIPTASLVVQAAYDSNALNVSSLSFDSSLLSLDGKGRIRRRNLLTLGEGKLTGKLHLTDEGKQILGGYLALAAHTAIDNPAVDWEVEVVFDATGQPLASIHPLS